MNGNDINIYKQINTLVWKIQRNELSEALWFVIIKIVHYSVYSELFIPNASWTTNALDAEINEHEWN
jgi:hypothetical protein